MYKITEQADGKSLHGVQLPTYLCLQYV